MLVSERIGQFFFDDHRIEYTEFGSGDRWVVLVPGPLMPRRMQQPLARTLAGAGSHVLTLDLLGHGRSDRPEDPLAYSLGGAADQVVTLLDELGAASAVLGGVSLGANVCLEVAIRHPQRVRGLLLEMPLLDNAVESGLAVLVPLLLTARFAPLAVTGVRLATHAVPRGVVPFWAGVGLDLLNQRPGPMAAALHGLLVGGVAPPSADRRRIGVPALVVGYRFDPVHRETDAVMLAEELPEATYVGSRSIVEWRRRPERLDALALDLVQRCDPSSARRATTLRGARGRQ